MKKKILFLCSTFLILFSCNQTHVSSETKNTNNDTITTVENDSAPQSIYHLEGTWINQDNKPIKLVDLKGKIQVVAMIFSSCKYACPMIVEDMKKIEKQIPADKKNKIGFTLVSFDVERDTPSQLKKFSNEMKLDDHWNLLRSNEQQVRELSMLLDVQYEKQEDGSFAHSNVITVLDKNGTIITRQEGLDVDSKETVQKILTLLNDKSLK